MQPAQSFGRRGALAPVPSPRQSAHAPQSQKPPPAAAATAAPPEALAKAARAARSADSPLAFMMDLLFGFEGRLGRAEYRMIRMVGYVLFAVFFYGFDALITRHRAEPWTVLALSLAIMVLTLGWVWSTLAVQVKRWHDRDKSGVWAFIGLVPLVGWIWVMVELLWLEGTMGPNQFGPSPRGDPSAVFA